jgi:dsDNA-specific endonuclease/ATPase MutS2
MTNAQIIQYQLKYFQKELENAIAANLKKVIFIHGVGNGRLKQEILAILRNYPEFSVQDASFKKYGFGATEVIINNN